MEDIRNACESVRQTAGEIGMTKNDLQKAKDLLEGYGSEREKLLEEMLSLLEKPDTSGLRDDWKNRCDKGKDLLERLNHDTPISPQGEGLRGVGAGNFADGEQKVWAKNGEADIASVANITCQIHKGDLELIGRCNEQLKTVRDGDKAVQALIEQNFGSMKTTLKNLTVTLVTKGVPALFSAFLKDRSSKDMVRDWGQTLAKNMDENLKAAKQKGDFKQIILQNIEFIQKTKDQLSEEWIEEIYKKGKEYSKSLSDLGENGDYKASDWEKFGQECIKRLAGRRDDAKQQSKMVFGELLPTFIEENNRAFAALTDDPSTLADWKSSMEDDFKSINDALSQGDAIVNDLADGPYKQAARETFSDIRDQITVGYKLFLSGTKDAEDEMKK